MPSIWAFCLQTLTVSVVALILLAIKRLLEDKLSPRWQYGIWALLAVRILLPAQLRRNILLPLGLWLEIAKTETEQGLASAFSDTFEAISIDHILPRISEKPQSVTDWLFVIYTAGVAALAIFYLVSYFALRLQLRRGQEASPEVTEAMARVCRNYGLKGCRTVAVPGLESAFVCGIFRPVLAVPADENVDDKVILHELLHLKHLDIPQNIFWALLRCLHWCNPLMHFVFDRIGNDMESLCDQRVLERLEGEERREYGAILLSMACRRYARSPGTGSISNGKKHISRRITAIARFKKYPQGMALVSVCIGLVLISPLLIGSAAAVNTELLWPEDPSEQHRAMAAARVQRCSTVAGAIDTYAKGILKHNGIYIAVASPLSAQQELLGQIPDNWHWDPGDGAEHINTESEYSVYDLYTHPDGSCSLYLAFPTSGFEDAQPEDWPTTVNGTPVISGTLVLPLRVSQENGSWVVTEEAPRIKARIRYDQIEFYGDYIPWLAEQTIPCETGTVTIRYRGRYQVDNQTTNSLFGWSEFIPSVLPDAQFASGRLDCDVIYEYDEACGKAPVESAALYVWYYDTPEELEKAEPGEAPTADYWANDCSGNYRDCHFAIETLINGWEQQLWAGINTGFGGGLRYEDLPTLPAGYLVQLLFDGEVVEELKIEVNPYA